MLVPTILMAVFTIVLFVYAMSRGDGQHITGLKSAGKMTLEVLPMLILAFILAGLIQTLVPKGQVSHWIGAESGLRGVLLGTLAGALTPGGPFVSMPLAAGFLNAGAGMGTMVAYMTSWSLLGVHRIPLEVGVLGWRFMVLRLCSTAVMAPVAGIIANGLMKLVRQ